MKNVLLAAVFAGVLLSSPAAMNADEHDRDRDHDRDRQHQTYNDERHGDRHEWNDNENREWNRYRQEHHVRQSEFEKANRRDQQAYWNWRHEHPDNR